MLVCDQFRGLSWIPPLIKRIINIAEIRKVPTQLGYFLKVNMGTGFILDQKNFISINIKTGIVRSKIL